MAYCAGLGITIKHLLGDNGSAFLSSDFARAWPAIGICHKFTRAYGPQANGRAERFIQSTLREWAYRWTYQSPAERNQALASCQLHHDWHRPHSGIGSPPPRLGFLPQEAMT